MDFFSKEYYFCGKIIFMKTALSLLLIVLSLNTFAQFGIAVNTHAGLYNKKGTATGGNLEIYKAKMVYSFGYNKLEEIEMLTDENPLVTSQMSSLMVGKLLKQDDMQLAFKFFGGLSAFWGDERTEVFTSTTEGDVYEINDFFTVGIGLRGGIYYYPIKFLSFGVVAQANFNKIEPVYLGLLTIGIEFH